MKKKLKVHTSSKTDEWSTPDHVFKELSDLYGPFELDVSATNQNSKCPFFFDQFINGLEQNWQITNNAAFTDNESIITSSSVMYFQSAWMNPPYSELKKWLEKAYNESRKGMRIVCLIPARTDTKAWHDYVMKAEKILFVKGRIKFGDSKNCAPFPSAVIIFDPTLQSNIQFETIGFNTIEKYKEDFDKLVNK